MSGLRDLLQRFRPAGPPGAPAAGGVPADRTAELAAELGPLLALLDDAEQQVRQIEAEAVERARLRRQRAMRQAEAIEERARQRCAAVRAESAAGVLREAQAEVAMEVETAGVRAQQVRDRAEERMSSYADRVIAELDEIFGELRRPARKSP